MQNYPKVWVFLMGKGRRAKILEGSSVFLDWNSTRAVFFLVRGSQIRCLKFKEFRGNRRGKGGREHCFPVSSGFFFFCVIGNLASVSFPSPEI